MFLYWNGYEIDGSDTDFDIVLPEQQEITEFVKCFLSIPVFGNSKPHIYHAKSNPHKTATINKTKLMELLEQGDRPELFIDINCQVMDVLPKKVQTALYHLSETRTPHEVVYGNVENPCMAPIDQQYHTRGNMTVSLTIMKPGTKKGWYTAKDAILDGYVHHEELLLSDDYDYPCFSLNVGPGFYYEYAIYIMEYLRDHFPGLGTVGGLDSSGGWTDGGTYSNSIYGYEKIQLPIKYNIRNSLKHLMDCDIVRSYRRYYKMGWNYDLLNEFRIVNIPKEKWGKEYLLSFDEYVDHVEEVLENQKNSFSSICQTAVNIFLPFPTRFEKRPELLKHLKDNLIDVKDIYREWHYCGYLAFAKVDGQVVGEFRVPWYMKSYLITLLEMKDSGHLGYIKSEVFQRQQYD